VGNIVGAAYIEAAMCQGCGICAAECPAQAIQLMHYRDAEMLPKIDALFDQAKQAAESFIPLSSLREIERKAIGR
jgi:ferredoxin